MLEDSENANKNAGGPGVPDRDRYPSAAAGCARHWCACGDPRARRDRRGDRDVMLCAPPNCLKRRGLA